MPNNHVPTSVAALFQSLAKAHGFVVNDPKCSGSFDQLLQIAEAEHLSIRFVRDRGDEFLEVGCGKEWFSPDLIRLVLCGGQPEDAPGDLQHDASFLLDRFDDIERMFLPDNQPTTLKALHDMRMKKARCMFPNAFIDDDSFGN